MNRKMIESHQHQVQLQVIRIHLEEKKKIRHLQVQCKVIIVVWVSQIKIIQIKILIKEETHMIFKLLLSQIFLNSSSTSRQEDILIKEVIIFYNLKIALF
jgi:hypothetical protein